MQFIGIDLAARHSAAVCVDEYGQPVWESTFDAGPTEKPPNPFAKARALANWWITLTIENKIHDVETYFVIEDIPPHLMNPKPVLKLQGALIGYMVLDDIECHLINAHDWQNAFGYKKKEHGDSKKWAAALAGSLGYVPGVTMPDVKILAKPKTDLYDGFLLARWLRALILGSD